MSVIVNMFVNCTECSDHYARTHVKWREGLPFCVQCADTTLTNAQAEYAALAREMLLAHDRSTTRMDGES